jgi:light-regulated signal transduction histidine kinase (bacteriophytochrome)
MDRELEALLAECAREPIRFPGKIQPHGALLVLDRHDLRVLCASENCTAYLGVDASTLLGRSLSTWLDSSPATLAFLNDSGGPTSALWALPQHALNALAHVSGHTAILELQPLTRPEQSSARLLQGTALALSAIHSAPDSESAIAATVREVQRLLGYDRVMAYCFDEQWNGQVVAERAQAGMAPLLGLRYPASDIPEQARALYAQNWLRVIPDVHYEPVMLQALDPSALNLLDLGHAVLRSVSPVHIEYLKNLGVSASLSISLRWQGKLWGLIACHHTQPRHVSFELLERCELIGCVLSSKLQGEHERARGSARNVAVSGVQRLLTRARGTDNLARALTASGAQLLEIMQASGAVILHRGELHTAGTTPDEAALRVLLAKLSADQRDEWVSAELRVEHPPARAYADIASGMLSLKLPDTQPAFVIWFRPELVQVVSWGGDPDKPLEMSEMGAGLGPRRSFQLWKEVVRFRSQPWTEAEREAAAELRRGIIEADLQRQLEREKGQRRTLEASNHELDHYAQVIAHDLLAPLRGIVAFSERMQRELAEGKLEQAHTRAHTVSRAAAGLSSLVRSLHQYSRVGQVELAIDDTDFNTLVELELERLGPFLSEQGADVTIAGELPTVRCDRVRLGVVLGNLISNAVKYNESKPKRVRIYSVSSEPVAFYVADNGIGIPAEHREAAFRIFRRLHAHDAYGGGSGMGLAIASKIVERHGGRMWIESTPGGGTTVAFTLEKAARPAD